MFALLAAIIFGVLVILHAIAHAGVDTILLDLGLLCVALALAFGPNFPVTLRRHA